MIDNVQLKQEEAVGNDVVLNDINPKTNTRSIDDSSSGLPLSYTLDRLWEAINNKLSRYVNSVNGRTGVVVLDKSDVGLDKVDNVSYSEIKDWVINRIQDEFKYKTLQLFNEYNEVDQWVLRLNNDPIYSGTPFYVEHGRDSDRRAYIGYIEYSNSMLNIHHRPINTIGATDNSIIYNENVGSKLYGGTGTIGVNIWSGQDVIKIHEGLTKDDSGLYIDETKLSKDVRFFDGLYGSADPSVDDALVYYNPSSSSRPTGGKDLEIWINGTQVSATLYTLRTFHVGDLILTNFSSENCLADPSTKNKGIILKEGILPDLVEKQSGFGIVKTAPDDENPNTPYEINFYTIKQNTTRGLKMYSNINGDTAIGVDLLLGGAITREGQVLRAGADSSGTNISGLSTLDDKHVYSSDDPSGEDTRTMRTILPTGQSGDPFEPNGTKNLSRTATGLFISPSFSLNIIPSKCFPSEITPLMDEEIGDVPLTNWPPRTTWDYAECSIGVNLTKIVDNPNDPSKPNLSRGINLSGLRIDRDSEQLSSNWLGYTRMNPVTYVRVYNEPFGWDNTCTDYYYKDQYGAMHRVTAGAIFDSFTYGIFKRYQDIKHSGGLSVNVGDFLKIGYQNNLVRPSSDYKNRQTFYDDGKVNLNVDTKLGLGEVTLNSNELGIRIAKGENIYKTSSTDATRSRQGGLKFAFTPTDDNVGYLAANTGDNTSDAGGLYVNNKNILGVKLYNTINDPTDPCSSGKINEPKSVNVLPHIDENDLIEHVSLKGRNPYPDIDATLPIEEICYESHDALMADFWNWIEYDGSSTIMDVDALKTKVRAGMDNRWNQVYNIEGERYIWDPIDTNEIDYAGRSWPSPFVKSKYGWFKKLIQIYNTIEESPVNISDPSLVSNNDKRYIYAISPQLETGSRDIKDSYLQLYTWNDPLRLMVPNITKGIYNMDSTEEIVDQQDQNYMSDVYSALSTAINCYLYEPGESPMGPKYQTYYAGSVYEKSVYIASTAYYFGSSTPGGSILGERGEYVDGVFYRGSGQTNPVTPQSGYIYTDVDLSTSQVKDYYYYDLDLNNYVKINRHTLLTEKPIDFDTHPENYYKLESSGIWTQGTTGAIWAVNTWYSYDDTQVILNSSDNTKVMFAKKIDPIALGSKTSFRPLNIPNRASDPYGNYYMPYEYRDNLPDSAHPTTSPGIQDGYKYRPIMPRKVGIFMTTDIMARIDIDRNGYINSSDKSYFLYYTSHKSDFNYGSPNNQRTHWMNFCTTPKEEGGLGFEDVYDGHIAPNGGWILQYSDEDARTGLKIGYNQHRGLTSNANSYIYMESKKDHSGFDEHLSIKIADSSAGLPDFDTSTNGGLRFTTDGFLAIRINDQNNYDASVSTKRGRAYRGDRISEAITGGTKGLRIYDGNILGVQLSPDGSMDNGTLMIDASGCLKISNAYTAHGGVAVEKFIMTDGTNRVEYNGGEEVTLNIGPGLKLVP